MPRPRSASKAPFPYTDPLVRYFTITDECVPEPISLKDLPAAVNDNRVIYAAWPGKSRTDIFVIDDIVALIEWIRHESTQTTP